jgi:hypothetical protein
LAAFLASVEAEEVLLVQRLRDAAARDVGRIGAPAETTDRLPPAPHVERASQPPSERLVLYGDY